MLWKFVISALLLQLVLLAGKVDAQDDGVCGPRESVFETAIKELQEEVEGLKTMAKKIAVCAHKWSWSTRDATITYEQLFSTFYSSPEYADALKLDGYFTAPVAGSYTVSASAYCKATGKVWQEVDLWLGNEKISGHFLLQSRDEGSGDARNSCSGTRNVNLKKGERLYLKYRQPT